MSGTSGRPASDAVLERLTRLHPKIIDLSLDRMWRILARLDHPERRLPPVVHVAGTNGKGSVIAYLRAMLEAAGRRVHVYTSPHLVRFHERIRLAGDLIDEAALLKALEAAEEANGEAPITFFEITTAVAFQAFAETPADILLLEVGLGGRLDATNVIDRPALSVITPVSLDHQQYLGESLREIAGEKAGILKPGVAAVIGQQPPQALAAIDQRAAEIGAPLAVCRRDWSWGRQEDGGFYLVDGLGREPFPPPALTGGHQRENAALAVAAARRLRGFGLDGRAVRAGLADARWPARLERITSGRFAEAMPADWELWVDGGHNAEAGRIIAEQAEAWGDRPLHVIFGMLNTKLARDFLRPIVPHAESLTAVAIPGEPNSLSAAQAAQAAREAGATAETATSVGAAIQAISGGKRAPGRVLICGSLYLAGRVLGETA